jgi:AcrR family transcriptional regulator
MEEEMTERSKEDASSKRIAILDAARDLFSRKGYAETTISEIAQAAGVAVGTVYLYFRNKHDILTGVSLDFEASITQALRDPALLNLPIEQVPRAMVDALFRIGRRKKELVSLLQIDMPSAEEVSQHKEANEHLTKALATFFQQAIDQGQLAPFDTEMYAQLLNLLGGAILHQCFAVEQGENEEMYRTTMIELLERLLFGPSLREGA